MTPAGSTTVREAMTLWEETVNRAITTSVKSDGRELTDRVVTTIVAFKTAIDIATNDDIDVRYSGSTIVDRAAPTNSDPGGTVTACVGMTAIDLMYIDSVTTTVDLNEAAIDYVRMHRSAC